MTTELMNIHSEPATLSVNFDEVRTELEKRVAEYDIVVTSDSVADAKKLATDLNRQKNEIEERRKAAVAEVSAPIKAFDEQMKELSGLFEEGRQKILVQVKRFEDETRELARELLESEREKLWKKLEVEPEFRQAEFDDLVKLSAVTKAGNLAASASGPLEQRCQADRSLQDRTRMRLMELENRSYKAGLKAPLTRDHVEHFLFDEEDRYESEIERILTAEVARQDRIEDEARRKAQREQERRQAEENEQARAAGEEPAQPDPEPTKTEQAVEKSGTGIQQERQAPEPAADGKIAWSVYCEFRIECSSKVTQQQIEQQLQTVMAQAGITSLQSVEAVRQEQEQAA